METEARMMRMMCFGVNARAFRRTSRFIPASFLKFASNIITTRDNFSERNIQSGYRWNSFSARMGRINFKGNKLNELTRLNKERLTYEILQSIVDLFTRTHDRAHGRAG